MAMEGLFIYDTVLSCSHALDVIGQIPYTGSTTFSHLGKYQDSSFQPKPKLISHLICFNNGTLTTLSWLKVQCNNTNLHENIYTC